MLQSKKNLTEEGEHCVYIATLPNGKKYVGMTVQGMELRAAGHIQLANSGKGNLFHNAIRKYGAENIKWEVIQSGISRLNAMLVEKIAISVFRSRSFENGYNLTAGGESGSVDVAPFFVYRTSGEYIGTYTSISGVAKILDVDAKNVQRCLKSRVKTHKRYIFTREKFTVDFKGIQLNRDRAFIGFDKDGNTVGTWNRFTDCAKDLNISPKIVRTSLMYTTRKTKSGYKFKYLEE